MKNPKIRNSKKSKEAPKNGQKVLANTRPSKSELKTAIEKSIKKNKETLKILSKR